MLRIFLRIHWRRSIVPIVQQLTPGQVLSGLRLVLTPGGVISGRLTNERGEVVAGAVVQALKTTHKNGLRERTLVQSVVSNDLGEYRFFMLKPGQYYISLVPPKLVDPEHHHPVFFDPVVLPGNDRCEGGNGPRPSRRRNDRKRGLPVDSHKESPHHRRRSGQWQRWGHVILSPVNGTAKMKVAITRDNPNPSFQFSDIVPGSYMLVAHNAMTCGLRFPSMSAMPMCSARASSWAPGFRIPSRARIEGHPPGDDPELEKIYFSVRPDVPVPGLEPELYSPFADGRFTLEVLKRDYWIDITRTEDYYIKSITLDGFDVLNQGLHVTSSVEGPMEIVIDNHFGEVQGSAAAPNVTVVLVPDAARRNQRPLYKSMKSSNGVFHFEKVPPGDYKLFAWSEDTIDNGGPWLDPEYLRKYEDRATPVRIQGDMKTILDRPIPVF